MTTPMPNAKATPYQITDETFVIPQLEFAPGFGFGYVNSLIIRGQEPVIVDTYTPFYTAQWLEYAWSIVDPEDVRWIFLSHDDIDHVGNLRPVLEACPNARTLTNLVMIARMGGPAALPLERVRILNGGEELPVGDRVLKAVVPPLYDSPTTRGLFDPKTGVYWAGDCFATPLPYPVENVAVVPEAAWREGFTLGNQLSHPWYALMDEAKYARYVDYVQSLPIRAIAAGHTPVVTGERIAQGFDLLRQLPRLPLPHLPNQQEFEALLAGLAGGAQPQAA